MFDKVLLGVNKTYFLKILQKDTPKLLKLLLMKLALRENSTFLSTMSEVKWSAWSKREISTQRLIFSTLTSITYFTNRQMLSSTSNTRNLLKWCVKSTTFQRSLNLLKKTSQELLLAVRSFLSRWNRHLPSQFLKNRTIPHSNTFLTVSRYFCVVLNLKLSFKYMEILRVTMSISLSLETTENLYATIVIYKIFGINANYKLI